MGKVLFQQGREQNAHHANGSTRQDGSEEQPPGSCHGAQGTAQGQHRQKQGHGALGGQSPRQPGREWAKQAQTENGQGGEQAQVGAAEAGVGLNGGEDRKSVV